MTYQNAERKKITSDITLPSKVITHIWGEIKSFPDEQKLKDSITANLALWEMLKGLLLEEKKRP